jgi:hypothetical protein
VSWSVGINVPPVGAVVSTAPAYVAAPAAYAPPGVVYSTVPPAYAAPVYAPPVVYGEPYVEPYVVSSGFYAPPVYVRPYHRYWGPRWAPRAPWHDHDHGHHDGGWHR